MIAWLVVVGFKRHGIGIGLLGWGYGFKIGLGKGMRGKVGMRMGEMMWRIILLQYKQVCIGINIDLMWSVLE